MIYKPGPLISEQRGSIGGITFTKNTSGSFARRRTVPVNPHTSAQLSVRAVTSYLSSSWRQLERNVMIAWNDLALLFPRVNRLGETYYLSGQQMYMFINRNLQVIGETLLTSPPDIANNIVAPFDSWSISIDCTPGTEDIKFNFSPVISVGQSVVLSATSVVSRGVFYPKNFKIIGVYNNTFTTGDSIKNDFLAIFGIMPRVKEAVFFRLHIVSQAYGFRCGTTQSRSIGVI